MAAMSIFLVVNSDAELQGFGMAVVEHLGTASLSVASCLRLGCSEADRVLPSCAQLVCCSGDARRAAGLPGRSLVRLGCARSLAILFTMLASLAAVGLFARVLGSQLINQGSTLLNDLMVALQRPELPFHSVLTTIEPTQLIELLRASLGKGLGVVGGAFAGVFGGVFLIVIVVYMLLDNGCTWRQLLRLLPDNLRSRFDRSVQKNVLGFLRGQITLMIFLSLASLLVFALLGVKSSLVLAIAVGVLDPIPGIGATLGVIVAAIVVLLTQGQWLALQVVIASVILQQIQDNLIHPRVMGRALEIQPVVLFFALFVGERLAGLLGVFLAITVAGMILGWNKDSQAEGSPMTTPLP